MKRKTRVANTLNSQRETFSTAYLYALTQVRCYKTKFSLSELISCENILLFETMCKFHIASYLK